MTYELCRGLYFACLIIAGVLFCLAVFLFFRMNVVKMVGDLTGRNAKKAIEDIRRKNEEMNQEQRGDKGWNHTYSQKLTEKISKSGKLLGGGDGMRAYTHTQKIKTQNFPGSNDTVVLQEASNAGETVVLQEMQTAGETVVLAEVAVTQTLHEGMLPNRAEEKKESVVDDGSYLFEIEYEIEFIHTDEEIALC